MMRKYHVRFLEGLGAATSPCLLSILGELFGTFTPCEEVIGIVGVAGFDEIDLEGD